MSILVKHDGAWYEVAGPAAADEPPPVTPNDEEPEG